MPASVHSYAGVRSFANVASVASRLGDRGVNLIVKWRGD